MPDARCLSTTCLMLYALRAGLTRNHPVPERPLAARRAWTGLHGERRPKTARTTGAPTGISGCGIERNPARFGSAARTAYDGSPVGSGSFRASPDPLGSFLFFRYNK